MPVREKLATWLAEQFGGVQVWNGLTQQCQTIPTADYYATRDAADALFVEVVEFVDWPRIVIEAAGRHGALEAAGVHPEQRGGPVVEDLCAGCIKAALLAQDRWVEWVTEGAPTPTPPVPAVDDPYRVLGEALRHRRAGAYPA